MGKSWLKDTQLLTVRSKSFNVSLYCSNYSQQNYVVFFKITRVLNVLPETIYEGRRG